MKNVVGRVGECIFGLQVGMKEEYLGNMILTVQCYCMIFIVFQTFY